MLKSHDWLPLIGFCFYWVIYPIVYMYWFLNWLYECFLGCSNHSPNAKLNYTLTPLFFVLFRTGRTWRLHRGPVATAGKRDWAGDCTFPPAGRNGRDGGWAHGAGRRPLWELCAGVHLQGYPAGLQHPVQAAGAGPPGLRQLLQVTQGCGQHLEGQGPLGQVGQEGRAQGLQPEQSLPGHQGKRDATWIFKWWGVASNQLVSVSLLVHLTGKSSVIFFFLIDGYAWLGFLLSLNFNNCVKSFQKSTIILLSRPSLFFSLFVLFQ